MARETPGHEAITTTRLGNLADGELAPAESKRKKKLSSAFGLYFEPDTWDGSDIFMPEGGVGWKFVVEDVKRAFTKAKSRNVELTSLAASL